MILLEGLALGFTYAMPIGSQNIFVIHCALKQGLPISYLTASAVALMDISLSLACFYGIGLLLDAVPGLKLALIGIGALYLMFIGCRLLARKPEKIVLDDGKSAFSLRRIVTTAFLLTWANPHALLDGTVLFGGFRSSLQPDDVLLFVLGMTSASAIWFFSLTTLVGTFRKAMNHTVLYFIQAVCGAVLVLLGGKMMLELWN